MKHICAGIEAPSGLAIRYILDIKIEYTRIHMEWSNTQGYTDFKFSFSYKAKGILSNIYPKPTWLGLHLGEITRVYAEK